MQIRRLINLHLVIFLSLQRIHKYQMNYGDLNYDLNAADLLFCLIVRRPFYLIIHFFE